MDCEVSIVDSIPTVDGGVITRYRLRAGAYTLEVIDAGCAITRLEAPDREGRWDNVVLGYADVRRYLGTGREYFGAVVGRVANRIANGRFALAGRDYTLTTNDGAHHLHGGARGFDRRLWTVTETAANDTASIAFGRISPDGECGYPGTLTAAVRYSLSPQGEVRLGYVATTDATTVVNLTNHSYFNLRGEGQGDVLGHRLEVDADRYVEVGEGLIPTGALATVDDTPFDFRRATPIGRRIGDAHPQLLVAGGYDHCMVLNGAAEAPRSRPACVLTEPESGRRLVVVTDRPGVQFYSGNFLDGSVMGPGGTRYERHAGLCLETQALPDAPNHPGFPSIVLEPGQRYEATTVWRFEVLP